MDKKQLAIKVIETWNSHDLDAFINLHSNSLEYSSPIIRKFTGKDIHTTKDNQLTRTVWEKALSLYPDIHSEILDVFEGSDSVAVYYKSSAKGNPIIDVMYFDEDNKVSKLNVYYS